MSIEEQLTKLPNGDKPSYEQLEESFLDAWDKNKILEKRVSELSRDNAELRYDLKMVNGTK